MATLTATTANTSSPVPAPRFRSLNPRRRDSRRTGSLYDVLSAGFANTIANPVCLGILVFLAFFLLAEFVIVGQDKPVGLLEYLDSLIKLEKAVKDKQRLEIVILNIADKVLGLITNYKTKIVVLAGYLVTVIERPTNSNLISGACFAAGSLALSGYSVELQLLTAVAFWGFTHTRTPRHRVAVVIITFCAYMLMMRHVLPGMLYERFVILGVLIRRQLK